MSGMKRSVSVLLGTDWGVEAATQQQVDCSCNSIEHSLHLYKRNVIKGTFEKPSTPNQLKLIDESASLSDFEEEEDTATSTSPSTPAAPSKAPQRLPAPA